MGRIDYPEDFLGSKLGKAHYEQLIAALNSPDFQIDPVEALGASRIETIAHVYEASKRLSKKRSKAAKKLGEELSAMVRECFNNYNFKSQEGAETVARKTDEKRKIGRMRSITEKIFPSVKKKRNLRELKEYLRNQEYIDAAEVAKELGTVEAAKLLIHAARNDYNLLRSGSPEGIQGVYALAKAAETIFSKNGEPANGLRDIFEKCESYASYHYGIKERFTTPEDVRKLAPMKGIAEWLQNVWQKPERESAKKAMQGIYGSSSYGELKRILSAMYDMEHAPKEDLAIFASRLAASGSGMLVYNIGKFKALPPDELRSIAEKEELKWINPIGRHIFLISKLEDAGLANEDEKRLLQGVFSLEGMFRDLTAPERDAFEYGIYEEKTCFILKNFDALKIGKEHHSKVLFAMLEKITAPGALQLAENIEKFTLSKDDSKKAAEQISAIAWGNLQPVIKDYLLLRLAYSGKEYAKKRTEFLANSMQSDLKDFVEAYKPLKLTYEEFKYLMSNPGDSISAGVREKFAAIYALDNTADEGERKKIILGLFEKGPVEFVKLLDVMHLTRDELKAVLSRSIELNETYELIYSIHTRGNLLSDAEIGEFISKALQIMDDYELGVFSTALTNEGGYFKWKLKEGMLTQDAAIKLIETGNWMAYFQNTRFFKPLSKQQQEQVASLLIKGGWAFALARNIEKLPHLSERTQIELVNTLAVVSTHVRDLTENFDKLASIPKEMHFGIAKKIIENWGGSPLVDSFEKFSGIGPEKHAELLEMLLEKGTFIMADAVMENFNKFSGIPPEQHEKYALRLFAAGTPGTLLKHLDKFPGIKQESYVEFIDGLGAGKAVLENLGDINVPPEQRKTIASNAVKSLLGSDEKFLVDFFTSEKGKASGINIIDLIEEHYPGGISNFQTLFVSVAVKRDWIKKFGEERVEKLLNALPKQTNEKRNAFTHNKYDRTGEFLEFMLREKGLFELTPIDLDIATGYIQKFGLSKTKKIYKYYKSLRLLENGLIKELPADQLADGITSLGELDSQYASLRSVIFGDRPMLATDIKTLGGFKLEVLENITGIATHPFHREPISGIIWSFERHSNTKSYEAGMQLLESYKPFTVIAHKPKMEFSPDAIRDEYNVLSKEIMLCLSGKATAAQVRESAAGKISQKISELGQAIREKPNPFLEKQAVFYKELIEKLKTAESHDRIMELVLEVDKGTFEKLGLYEEARLMIIGKVVQRHYSERAAASELLTQLSGEITAESITVVANFVNNFVHNHAVNVKDKNDEIYWDDASWKAIRAAKKNSKKVDIAHVFSPYIEKINAEVANFQVGSEGNAFNVRCIPDRGIMGAMSGYLAQACYTRETNMLEDYPNVVPYKFVVDQGGGDKKFIGSVLLFEVKDSDGRKAALVRAFNVPKEGEVNIGEFIGSFVSGIEEPLRKRGISRIICPGKDGAMSNYASAIAYFHRYRKDENRVILADEFMFNRYDLKEDCYLVKVLE